MGTFRELGFAGAVLGLWSTGADDVRDIDRLSPSIAAVLSRCELGFVNAPEGLQFAFVGLLASSL